MRFETASQAPMRKLIFAVLDSRVTELALVAVLTWGLHNTGLLATDGTLHFGGLGYGVLLLVAVLWTYSILFD